MKTFKNGRKPQKSEKSHFLLHNVLTKTLLVYTYGAIKRPTTVAGAAW